MKEQDKQEIIEAYQEYLRVYPKFQEYKRIVKTQNPRALSRLYDVSYSAVRYLLGLYAPEIRIGKKDLSSLNTRQRKILELRKQGHTLQEIGKSMGLSRQRVQQIQTQALKHLTKLK